MHECDQRSSNTIAQIPTNELWQPAEEAFAKSEPGLERAVRRARSSRSDQNNGIIGAEMWCPCGAKVHHSTVNLLPESCYAFSSCGADFTAFQGLACWFLERARSHHPNTRRQSGSDPRSCEREMTGERLGRLEKSILVGQGWQPKAFPPGRCWRSARGPIQIDLPRAARTASLPSPREPARSVEVGVSRSSAASSEQARLGIGRDMAKGSLGWVTSTIQVATDGKRDLP
ncbi:hypothetical protein BU15DRAFT_67888 [Melanogaster broomeanus]|nr:hypothetical protein BU15DRAFT_67888 [Melanogaster broomeanus]